MEKPLSRWSASSGGVVELAHHDLEVALEQARADADHQQGANHNHDGRRTCPGGDGHEQIAQEHHDDTDGDAAAKANLVGHGTTHDGQEIDQHQEGGEHGARQSLAPAEVGLEEKCEDGQHGVVAKTLAGIGKRQGIKAFRLIFKHSFLF